MVPKSWSTRDIVKAGEHVASLKSNQSAGDGVTMWGTYKGVRVGVIKSNGKIATVFPDIDQSSVLKKRGISNGFGNHSFCYRESQEH